MKRHDYVLLATWLIAIPSLACSSDTDPATDELGDADDDDSSDDDSSDDDSTDGDATEDDDTVSGDDDDAAEDDDATGDDDATMEDDDPSPVPSSSEGLETDAGSGAPGGGRDTDEGDRDAGAEPSAEDAGGHGGSSTTGAGGATSGGSGGEAGSVSVGGTGGDGGQGGGDVDAGGADPSVGVEEACQTLDAHVGSAFPDCTAAEEFVAVGNCMMFYEAFFTGCEAEYVEFIECASGATDYVSGTGASCRLVLRDGETCRELNREAEACGGLGGPP